MTELLRLPEEQRNLIFTNAGFQAGLLSNVVEKDWWVTLVLKAVFRTEYSPYLLFKGGTSLSKCWKLISRFSEDIDPEFAFIKGAKIEVRPIKTIKQSTSFEYPKGN